MMDLVTLTVNPTIDIAYEVDCLKPVIKLRATAERHDPGGGGINVARVFVRLGGNARCHYLAGGATGNALDGLLDLHQLVRVKTTIASETRISTTILERETGVDAEHGREFRIVPAGPKIAAPEWEACLDRLGEARCDYIVASGSLPQGLPDDFYARAGATARKSGIRFVLDSSGRGLAGGLADGGVFLVKPSLEELRTLSSDALENDGEIAEAAMRIVTSGKAQYVAVTLAERGAILASEEGTWRVPAIPVQTRSSVGAGDSFLAAMVHRLALGKDIRDALRFGIAAGAAAAITPGTDLAHTRDIDRLRRTMALPP